MSLRWDVAYIVRKRAEMSPDKSTQKERTRKAI